MDLIEFRLTGRYAHFLRAESSTSALSYPLPPRTVILGLLGAILGLEKDTPQMLLEPANIAIHGRFPQTHWHRAKLRKNLPDSLPYIVKKGQKGSSKEEKPTLILQEWLINPEYLVWVNLPKSYNKELKRRLQNHMWYYTPYLGISEMIADIEYRGTVDAKNLPKGEYNIESAFRYEDAELNVNTILNSNLSVNMFQMPREVTSDRVFTHSTYVSERDGRPIPATTNHAHQVENRVILFL